MSNIESINILYIHGMGGGGDSRIPRILSDYYKNKFYCKNGSTFKIDVIVKTYSFDPQLAYNQIQLWVKELHPSLIIGESLGSIQAIRIKNIPHILVSPSLGAPLWLGYLAFLTLIPGVRHLLNRIYKPKDGDRQALNFSFTTLRKYRKHRIEALKNTPKNGSSDYFFAFFGTKDHYRKYGVVSICLYKKYFGNNFAMYDGCHFMEEEFLLKDLISKVAEVLDV